MKNKAAEKAWACWYSWGKFPLLDRMVKWGLNEDQFDLNFEEVSISDV